MEREYSTHGLPSGTYEVFYYRLESGELRRTAAYDRNVSLGYVERITVAPNEMADAVCRSQPGGVVIYGSEAVRRAAKALWGEG